MQEVRVLLYVESRYKVDRKRIRKAIANLLKEQGVTSSVEVSVAIIGDRKMRELTKKYKNEDKTSNVLSFPLAEGEPSALPNDIARLGDVIISYPQVIKEAAQQELLVDERIEELVRHGLMHLLGLHHEE